MGWFYLSIGVLVIVVEAYVCFTDDRTMTVVLAATQILVGLLLVWTGARRIYEARRAAS